MELLEIGVRERLTANGRYDVLHRVRRLADARGVHFVGFDLSNDIRLMLEGDAGKLRSLARSLKSGTVQHGRAVGRPVTLGVSLFRGVVEPREALVQLHREAVDGGDPLSTPWSSHRDLLGFRRASFFDPDWWVPHVDPRWVHLRCKGQALPALPSSLEPCGLDLPLRVSAAVLGVMPADPTSFRLFSQLARWNGSRQIDIADALMLTPRRIRQLQAKPDPRLRAAVMGLTDRRLRNVP